jgi:hypothetical protein
MRLSIVTLLPAMVAHVEIASDVIPPVVAVTATVGIVMANAMAAAVGMAPSAAMLPSVVALGGVVMVAGATVMVLNAVLPVVASAEGNVATV